MALRDEGSTTGTAHHRTIDQLRCLLFGGQERLRETFRKRTERKGRLRVGITTGARPRVWSGYLGSPKGKSKARSID